MRGIRIITIGIIALSLVSCHSQKPVVLENKTTVVETVTIRDTLFTIQPDSTYYKAYIACIEGKPKLVNPETKKGKGVLNVPQVKLDDTGNLYVACESEILQLKAQLKDQNKEILKEVQVPIYVPADITGWQWFQIWMGRLFAFALLALLIGYFIKYKK